MNGSLKIVKIMRLLEWRNNSMELKPWFVAEPDLISGTEYGPLSSIGYGARTNRL